MSKVFEIQTSCGSTFKMPLDEMSNRQLSGLIDGNPDNPDTGLLRAELERRQKVIPSTEHLVDVKAMIARGLRRAKGGSMSIIPDGEYTAEMTFAEVRDAEGSSPPRPWATRKEAHFTIEVAETGPHRGCRFEDHFVLVGSASRDEMSKREVYLRAFGEPALNETDLLLVRPFIIRIKDDTIVAIAPPPVFIPFLAAAPGPRLGDGGHEALAA